MKAEMEMAMKLLEKDVHHKQDTIVCLRDQLEDIKDINLEMYTKLQVPTPYVSIVLHSAVKCILAWLSFWQAFSYVVFHFWTC